METRNGKVLTIYATERKRLTKEQRHLYKFKKKYNYKDIGNDIGVINSNGKSYYVDMDLKNKEPITVNKSIHTPIQIGSNILKLKPKYADSVLQHELGHANMHYTKLNNNTEDKKKYANYNLIRAYAYKYLIQHNIQPTAENIDKYANNVTNELYKQTSNKNQTEFQKERNELLNYMQRRSNYRIDATPMEYEADRFAANRTNKSDVKRALRKMNKLNKGSKLQNKLLQDNYERRSKALDDPKISSSDIYK